MLYNSEPKKTVLSSLFVFPFVRKVVDGGFDAGLSWACLEEGPSGQTDSALELVIRDLTSTDAGILAAEKGIGSFRLLSTPDRDGSRYAQTIFYTQTETVGERAQTRIRSILLQPMADVDVGDKDGIGMLYTDYDLSIPDADFRVVTLGASQYLYWLSTLTKEKESDPDIWRINGVYCDAATGIMSDEIVIAEFTLPDTEWNGRTYGSVPFEVTLTESGAGFITAKPNTPEEDSTVAPLTLYSFPITLRQYRTIRRHVWRCLFRRASLADFLIYLQ